MRGPWLREDHWLYHVFELKASDLLSKGGFNDGDLLDDMLGDHGYQLSCDEKYTGPCGEDSSFNNTYHIVLVEVGRKYLFPWINECGSWPFGLGVLDTHPFTAHNPLRCEGMGQATYEEVQRDAPEFLEISVGVPGRKILELADLIYPSELRKDHAV